MRGETSAEELPLSSWSVSLSVKDCLIINSCMRVQFTMSSTFLGQAKECDSQGEPIISVPLCQFNDGL